MRLLCYHNLCVFLHIIELVNHKPVNSFYFQNVIYVKSFISKFGFHLLSVRCLHEINPLLRIEKEANSAHF